MSRLTTTKLADWLRPFTTSGAKVIAGRVPDMPNRVIGIVKTPGSGLEMDGLTDVVMFQVSARGGENNLADSEMIANEVDDIFIGKHATAPTTNFLIGVGSESVFISGVGRLGGEPSQLTLPDSQSRWTFTCTYYAYVSTNVGQVFNG
jgi:hypothetical protein